MEYTDTAASRVQCSLFVAGGVLDCTCIQYLGNTN